MTTGLSTRRYELDWIRVMAILVVFFYHSARFFNLKDWHVKNAETHLWGHAFMVSFYSVFLWTDLLPAVSLVQRRRQQGVAGIHPFYGHTGSDLPLVCLATVCDKAAHPGNG